MWQELLLLAQEEGGHAEEPSGLDLILPAVDELVWGTICFALVLFVLSRKAFPAIRSAMEKREQTIQQNLESAESAKNEAATQLQEYKKQLAEARSEANRIIEEARQAAEQVRKDITAKAEQEAQQIVARAQEQLAAERTRTVSELQTTIGDLSIELAEKVVGRAIDGNTHRELVDAYIREVASTGGRNN
jgi:F-type H+-transporting ATPase subunit b